MTVDEAKNIHFAIGVALSGRGRIGNYLHKSGTLVFSVRYMLPPLSGEVFYRTTVFFVRTLYPQMAVLSLNAYVFSEDCEMWKAIDEPSIFYESVKLAIARHIHEELGGIQL